MVLLHVLPGWTQDDSYRVLSGFAATDLSVRFRDARQGAEPMEKRPLCGLSFPHHETARFSRAFTRMLLPLATARQQGAR